jgi:hypothetical protein
VRDVAGLGHIGSSGPQLKSSAVARPQPLLFLPSSQAAATGRPRRRSGTSTECSDVDDDQWNKPLSWHFAVWWRWVLLARIDRFADFADWVRTERRIRGL